MEQTLPKSEQLHGKEAGVATVSWALRVMPSLMCDSGQLPFSFHVCTIGHDDARFIHDLLAQLPRDGNKSVYSIVLWKQKMLYCVG